VRLRDELWALGHTWVVAARPVDAGAFRAPPADAFWSLVLEVPRLSVAERDTMHERGLHPEERELLEGAALPPDPTPRELVALVREVTSRSNGASPASNLEVWWRERRERAAALGQPEQRALAELEAIGRPVSAHDDDLLRRLEWSRPYAQRVLARAELVGVYVPGGTFGGPRRDVELFRRLHHESAGQRIIVRGESGSGKTSLILRVIGDVGRLEGSACEPFRITVGDVEMIASVTAFLQSILGTIPSQEGRFANVDAEVLAEAAAVEQTTIKRQVTHRAGLNSRVGYQAELTEPVETFKTATTPTQLREHLNDVLARSVTAASDPWS
jgi:hypothetical protein